MPLPPDLKMLPFTETQFFELFGRYNETIWPAP
jgi:hypothetical protein